MADLALFLEALQGSELILGRVPSVNAVELVEVYAFDAQAPEAPFAGFGEVGGVAVFDPVVRARAVKAALGGDDEAGRVGMEGFGDQFLADEGAVGVGGVEEVDAEFDGPAEDTDGFGVVRWRSPDAGAADAHGAETEAGDGEIASEGEFSGGAGGKRLWLFHGMAFLSLLTAAVSGRWDEVPCWFRSLFDAK